jgi:hypothetical protein
VKPSARLRGRGVRVIDITQRYAILPLG